MQRASGHIVYLCLGFLLALAFSPTANAGEVRVAVAANFLAPAKAVASQYEKEKQSKVTLIPSSTGKIYAQIENGAPFDLFLAADSRRPQLLFGDGLCQAPFTYAIGRVILWTSRKDLACHGNWREVLTDPSIRRIALAQPETAPYGGKAQEALQREGLWQGVKDRMVFGQNVAQAFQYGVIGSVDLAFIALSFASSEKGVKGHYWPVPEAESVVQQGCILRGRNEAATADFVHYLLSDRTAAIFKKYGYERDRS